MSDASSVQEGHPLRRVGTRLTVPSGQQASPACIAAPTSIGWEAYICAEMLQARKTNGKCLNSRSAASGAQLSLESYLYPTEAQVTAA